MPGRPAYWRNVGTNTTVNESISTEDIATFAESAQTDDFFYDAEPVTKYATLGTFATVAGAGGQVKWTSGTTAGNACGISNASNGTVDPTKKLVIKTRAALTTADTELFAHIGAVETLPTAADPPVESDDGIYFKLTETTANANWFAVTRVGGVQTAVDTGIVVDLDVLHDFEIVLNDLEATFKIDGTIVGTSRTNLPLVALLPLLQVVTGDTNAKAIRIDALTVANSR